MKKAKKSSVKEDFSAGGPLEMSLGSLLRGGNEPARRAEETAKPAAAKQSGAELDYARIPRVSLQRQTAGRGGKTVTVVILPRDVNADLDALAKDMRRGLGCGSRVEDGRVVLQGDICDRAAEWLEKKGVRKIVQ